MANILFYSMEGLLVRMEHEEGHLPGCWSLKYVVLFLILNELYHKHLHFFSCLPLYAVCSRFLSPNVPPETVTYLLSDHYCKTSRGHSQMSLHFNANIQIWCGQMTCRWHLLAIRSPSEVCGSPAVHCSKFNKNQEVLQCLEWKEEV